MLKTVTGNIYDATGGPIMGATVAFQLDDIGLHSGGLYVPTPVSTITDMSGYFTIDLWVNQSGLTPTKYRVSINKGAGLYISIPNVPDPVVSITDIHYVN